MSWEKKRLARWSQMGWVRRLSRVVFDGEEDRCNTWESRDEMGREGEKKGKKEWVCLEVKNHKSQKGRERVEDRWRRAWGV
jgi:hypothetical protein